MSNSLPTTITFADWLQAVELEELEPYALYQAVENFTTEGPFTCSPGRGEQATKHLVTTPGVELGLELVSDLAHRTFLMQLRKQYMNDMQPDVWLSIQKEKEAR